jgi:uncharacterized protein with HEPN domain
VKSKREYIDYLRDILDSATKARRFVEGVEFDTFAASEEKIFAVFHSLQVIGEAAKNIPESIRKRCPEIPWREVCGMRDRLIHGYFGVNLRRVWETVQNDLPVLQTAIARALSELEATKNR